ncbi:hypothetical protein BACUNI_01779 [Bacteroides uniformis ATCC 8492]|uniref:Molecular chaperone DnaJ n=1 Tax=Bacteroides uniformis (strain ATCC 8492 / DSM 6597 / CCUG 4942 / CIP 103695 / JCM 5828 / KCTC 5204 / NCTC 13054 / VPI 0061) TaxID=411479 RepID=A0ABC9NDJ5_BACUC|nr:hypothetical protein BACUNI_01779 [Bacteroides uniformis ATCC 8492]
MNIKIRRGRIGDDSFQTPGCATCGVPCRSGAKLRP